MLAFARLCARFVGLSVAAMIAVVATQFLLLGFEAEPIFSSATVTNITDWLERPPLAGPGVLGAIALVALGLIAAAGTLWPRRGDPAITVRRKSGWTRIDRASLEAAVDRRLEAVDRRNDVASSVRRSGRIDVDVTATDFTAGGTGAELREALDGLCEDRRLPCRPGTISIKPRRSTGKPKHLVR